VSSARSVSLGVGELIPFVAQSYPDSCTPAVRVAESGILNLNRCLVNYSSHVYISLAVNLHEHRASDEEEERKRIAYKI